MKSNAPLGTRATLLWALVAAASFHLAYLAPPLAPLVAGSFYAILQLTHQPTSRRAFYAGLAIGFSLYAPPLWFFHTIFGPAAVVLWLVLAFWLGLYFLLMRNSRLTLKPGWFVVAAAFAWTGLEYFRSELYYLRFSWLNAGYAFASNPPAGSLRLLGGYGLGFALMFAAAGTEFLLRRGRRRSAAAGFVAVVLLAAAWEAIRSCEDRSASMPAIEVAGAQLEFPSEKQAIDALDKVLQSHPDADLVVLSEYTFDGPPPETARDWCRRHRKYLVVGGKQPATNEQFYNTAFVIGPSGEVVFQQVKSVPIQFFKDGLPAPRQDVWASPWGRLGICICYDLSYTRVTDRLVRQGAQALIVPTMDVAEWGEAQHELHRRVAPIRAAEYGVPIFRVASSGVSQLIDRRGREVATAPFPGQEAIIGGSLSLAGRGRLPLDRWLGLVAVVLTAGLACWLAWKRSRIEPD